MHTSIQPPVCWESRSGRKKCFAFFATLTHFSNHTVKATQAASNASVSAPIPTHASPPSLPTPASPPHTPRVFLGRFLPLLRTVDKASTAAHRKKDDFSEDEFADNWQRFSFLKHLVLCAGDLCFIGVNAGEACGLRLGSHQDFLLRSLSFARMVWKTNSELIGWIEQKYNCFWKPFSVKSSTVRDADL